MLITGVTQHIELDIARLLADRGIEFSEFSGYGMGDASIGSADFEEVFGLDQMDSEPEPAFDDFVEPESFIGWSADGRTWGWQTVADAFGVNGWV